jgi:predicted Zn-dependent protease
MKIKFQLFTFLSIVLFLTSCARNPVTGNREFSFMSESQEKALGAESDPQIVAMYGLYADAKLQEFINKKGKEMAAISHRPNLGYEFKIMDSPIINAFAVPGGYVYFTRGIMAHFNNEAEFAGVLGHEIGHITAKHAAAMQRKQIFTQGALIGGMIFSETIRQNADALSQGVGLLFLKYSRDHESQSDKLGVEYSTAVGYNSHKMAEFFHTLERSSGTDGAIPTMLSTHPNPGDRFNNVNKYTDEVQAAKGVDDTKLAVNRNSYLKMIDGLVFGEDPRQGYFENNAFYHPTLLFSFGVPIGWATQNTPSQVQMAPKDNKALMTLTLAQGTDLTSTASAIIKDNKISVIESTATTVNGLQAYAILGDVVNTDEQGKVVSTIRAMIYLIKYNDIIYNLSGLSAKADFSSYQLLFQNSMKSFNRLTDQSKINKLPARIKIVEAKTSITLQDALLQNGTKQASLNEMAILNGMDLKDKLTAGTLFKIVINNAGN